jgi:hypothetical protein
VTSAKKTPARVVNFVLADEDHAVLSVEGGRGSYRRKPCKTCPWRKDAVGEFPAEAFRISAHTSYDMSDRTFGCHSNGPNKPATCAGFLLRGSDHNLAVRLGRFKGKFQDVSDNGLDLFDSYREMAEANGVDSTDPVLKQCRS